MTSRLDRLFILLESGQSGVTRRIAAKQIGEVQKLYPHELHTLLNRLIGYLHNTSWDTRIAAAQAIEAILINVPEWKPEQFIISSNNVKIKTESSSNNDDNDDNNDNDDNVAAATTTTPTKTLSTNILLSFSDFNLDEILNKGARLIGSEGIEFDINDEIISTASNISAATSNDSNSSCVIGAATTSTLSTANINDINSAERQRALINEKLGLTQASKLGVNLLEIITDEDMIRPTGSGYNINEEKVPVEHILNKKSKQNQAENNTKQLSCREINRAKRKARQISSTSSQGSFSRSNSVSNGAAGSSGNNTINTNNQNSDEPETKKKRSGEVIVQEIYYNLNNPIPDGTGTWVDAIDWPLENFCARLYIDLFNPKWEIRHGAATGLRELINNHSAGAGKSLNMTQNEMQLNHSLWLEDAALRLLCVLCLDRFGDFVSDQVVAPVRETCAQVLGTIVKEMDADKVDEIVKILLKLLKQNDWEVRHGGLLGLKYIFVVREDLLKFYLPQTISDILLGLFDAVDDVGAVAASTLIPVASWLPKLLTPIQVSTIVKMLWDLLLDQDELTSACNSFMGLLAAILSLPNASNWIQMEPMSALVPRLWPFLLHSTSSVRKSTLITLQTLTRKIIKIEKTEPTDMNVDDNSKPTTLANSKIILSTPNVSDINFDVKKLKLNFGVIDWQWPLLQEAMRHIYQRILVEPIADIQLLAKNALINLIENANLSALLHASCPFVSAWLCLAMQPPKLAFDATTLIQPTTVVTSDVITRRRPQRIGDDLGGSQRNATLKLYLGGSEATSLEIRERNYMCARITAARVLGTLSQHLVKPAPGVVYTANMEGPMDCYSKVLLGHLNSRSAVQRIVCSLTIAFWAQIDDTVRDKAEALKEKLRYCSLEYVYYDEVAVSFTRLLQEAHDLIATFKQYKVPINDFNNAKILTIDQIEALATTYTEGIHRNAIKPKIADLLEDRRKSLQNSFQQTSGEQLAYNISTQAALAGAIVTLHYLPDKLNPVVKPLMESIKREDCQLLQELSAEFLVQLMDQICDRIPSPNSKILTNLCMLLKSDVDFTPKILNIKMPFKETIEPKSAYDNCIYYGVITLNLQQQNTQVNGNNIRSTASTPTTQTQRGPGRPPNNHNNNNNINDNMPTTSRGPGRPPSNAITAAIPNSIVGAAANGVATNENELKQCRIQRIGAACAITKLCRSFGGNLLQKIPVFKDIMFVKVEEYTIKYPTMNKLEETLPDMAEINDLLTSLQLIEIAAPYIHENLHEQLFELLPKLSKLLAHPLKAIRHMTARCIATIAAVDDCQTMDYVVNNILILLHQIQNVIQRQGAIETIERVVDKLQIKIIPYIVLLIVPLLGCMSDSDESVRLISTHCFANLIQLMPLDSKFGKNEIKSKELQARKTRDREFLDYLFKPKTIPDYKVPIEISVELRTYQQAGVNWLWFLNKYNLHGILCDDMGLGKTLQTICILAGDHYQRQIDAATSLPSLVICPPTLTGHWIYEIEKFLKDSTIIQTLHYVGLPVSRERLRCFIGPCNLVVASYDTVRKDIDFLNKINWNYCVLDEGHIIKNGKTKCSKAIKTLKANHRLILSGTPIQNNVLELWSLFDFLMPGFLGTEKQFNIRFSRPILASRDSKSSAKEQESGVLAMESLHRQVLPFLLRRVKEDVLTDLPPKITQDLLCELSPLQERLYEDFSKEHLNNDIKNCLENLGDGENLNTKTHIFNALRYLQNVCNHPKLVLSSKHPQYERILMELKYQHSSLNDIEHSAKLPALKQLLLDCGIGVQTESVSQHRALIFCQLKSMLNIIEKDLLEKHMPTVTYLRLDGSVPASSRQNIVNTFNGDPSIDVLLLTTQAGGLGLNLTGADTVIFVEHDWNPMKDLQAMDRAHRIGQKKVVNVYRLITRRSLEEKIMNLQKFKLLTANTVVSAENASMDTMVNDQIFDLFNLNDANNKNCNSDKKPSNSSNSNNTTNKLSMNALIDNLPELWSENQYDDEYDITNFVQGLKK